MKKPKWNDDFSEYIKDFKFAVNYKSRYLDNLKENDYFSWIEKEEKEKMGRKKKKYEHPATAADRARYVRDRRTVEGSLITQKGFEGALVLEHIKGSQYLIRMPDGTEVFASHKKQPDLDATTEQSVSAAGWRLWDLGSSERL